MKRRDTLLRLRRFRVDELKRRMGTLDGMKADLERKLADLEDTVARERQRANATDTGRLAFPSPPFWSVFPGLPFTAGLIPGAEPPLSMKLFPDIVPHTTCFSSRSLPRFQHIVLLETLISWLSSTRIASFSP